MAAPTFYPSLHIRIEGHTDDRGRDDKNMALSQARAEAVRQYLIEHGVAANRLTAKGFGETKPAADNGTRAGRARTGPRPWAAETTRCF